MTAHNELLASQRILSMLEGACEHSEEVLDNVPSVFVVLNHENRIIRSNRMFCDLVGETMGSILHRDFASFFNDESRALLLHHFREVRGSSDPQARANAKLELECAGEGGAAKPFFWRMSRLQHPGAAEGAVISVIGSDLSELYQSELKLMSIFSSIPLGLLIIDRDGVVMEVLSEYCQVLLNQSSLNGCSLPELLRHANEDRRSEIDQVFEHLRAHASRPAADFQALEANGDHLDRLRTGDGSAPSAQGQRWIRARFQPIVKNQVVEHYLAVVEDITASQVAQSEIAKADLLGRQAKALYECAIRDPLSGLYTRLFMTDSVSPLLASAKRGNLMELAVVMLDIDHFKKVNDTFGHDAGDMVIRAVGQIIKSCVRDTDIPIRYGGEEFVLALPTTDTGAPGGAAVAERIRAQLESYSVDIGGGRSVKVTTSCGVAYCNENDTLDGLIQRADKYLYEAKHGGRNRVCVEQTSGA